MFWLAEGDTNSKFFHASTSTWKKLNHISSLMSNAGFEVINHDGMCNIVKNYFNKVFAESNISPRIIMSLQHRIITKRKNNRLTSQLSFEEFSIVVKQMHPDKSSGLDSLKTAFFKHFWGLLGEEIFKCCKGWLQNVSFLLGINDTNLVLIPKKMRMI